MWRTLAKRPHALWRRTLQAVSERSSYTETKAALLRLRSELRLLNKSAVTSLDEGLEETLTLHRLGLFRALGLSLKTTHCIESLLSQVGAYTDTVDRWRTSEQQHRWVASALLTIEPRLHRITGLPAPAPAARCAAARDRLDSPTARERGVSDMGGRFALPTKNGIDSALPASGGY